jgi:carboxypeptidase PM20D1
MPAIILILAALFLLAAILLIRTYLFVQKASQETEKDLPGVKLPAFKADKKEAAAHLSDVIKLETITHEDPSENVPANFVQLHKVLEKNYPLVHKTMKREVVGENNLLFTWAGEDSKLEPVLFAAHQDVVPAEETSLSQWTYPPFSGKIADGFIWGRGTLDIKNQLISLMESAEALIKNGYQPERTVMFGFGADEEVLGVGAKDIVALLKKRGIHLAAMVDEGGCIYENIIPGVHGKTGMIGLAEKGYLSLRVWVDGEAGHSSTPSADTTTGTLIRALDKLVAHPFPTRVGAVSRMFAKLAGSADFMLQLAFANLWLFSGIVRKTMLSNGETAASVRTTSAVTILRGGVKDNILPGHAEAVVNFRLLPGESIASVCERIRRIIKDDRVQFEPLRGNAWEASPVSPDEHPAFQHIASAAREFFPGTPFAPYIMLGGSDARNYYVICDNVYRFSPCVMVPEDVSRVHGVNERISVDDFALMVEYFYNLIPRWAQKDM